MNNWFQENRGVLTSWPEHNHRLSRDYHHSILFQEAIQDEGEYKAWRNLENPNKLRLRSHICNLVVPSNHAWGKKLHAVKEFEHIRVFWFQRSYSFECISRPLTQRQSQRPTQRKRYTSPLPSQKMALPSVPIRLMISKTQQSQKLGEPSSMHSSSISANGAISKHPLAPPPPLLVPIRCRFPQNQYQPVSSTCIYRLLHWSNAIGNLIIAGLALYFFTISPIKSSAGDGSRCNASRSVLLYLHLWQVERIFGTAGEFVCFAIARVFVPST